MADGGELKTNERFDVGKVGPVKIDVVNHGRTEGGRNHHTAQEETSEASPPTPPV
jgi:hypothetical protein